MTIYYPLALTAAESPVTLYSSSALNKTTTFGKRERNVLLTSKVIPLMASCLYEEPWKSAPLGTTDTVAAVSAQKEKEVRISHHGQWISRRVFFSVYPVSPVFLFRHL